VEGRQRELVVLAIATLLVAGAARGRAQQPQPRQQPPSQAGSDGTASGHLTVNAVTVRLTHAYADAEPGVFDKKTEDVRVLLSDVPLAKDALADVFALIELAREDRAHVVEVRIDASGTPIGGAIYAKAFDGMVSAAGMHTFTRERFERTRIAGRLAVPEPHTFNDITWNYDATFSAAIPRPPTAAELAAALASPPAKAAAAYVAAAIARREMAPDTHVATVDPQEDGTVLVGVEGHENGIVIGYTLQVVREADGVWKVAKQL
jgi:hypothetical protein